jgi:hypothetical protein
MRMHVVYRSTGKENRKARPAFYSKLLSLLSFIRALEVCEAPMEAVFLNDGPIPGERLDLMASAGEVASLTRASSPRYQRALSHSTMGGAAVTRSYFAALRLIETRGWPDGDLVYLVEDDYLHHPHALERLFEAANGLLEASYFGLYATIDWAHTAPFHLDESRWYTGESTTLTYAARVGALRTDRWIHRLSPFAAGAADRDSCLAYQGIRPFRWSYLIGDLLGNAPGRSGTVAGRVKRAGLQTAMNMLAIRSAFRRHLLICPDPPLATHLEIPHLAPGADWEALAHETLAWARERDLPLPAAVRAQLA